DSDDDRLNRIEAKLDTPLKHATSERPEFTHSPDCRCVTLRGRPYTMGPKQARVVQLLHEAWKQGTPDLSGSHLMESVECGSGKLSELFQQRDFSGAFSGFREIRMNEEAQAETATRETPARIEEHVRYRLTGLLREFQLVFRDKGLVLRGHFDGRPVAISSTTATTGYALEH